MAFSFGPIEYNGIVMDTGLKVSCKMNPVYSRSGMKIEYVEYTISVNAIITNDGCTLGTDDFSEYCHGKYNDATPDSTDGRMISVREQLLRECGRLKAYNIGLGFDLDIDSGIFTTSYEDGENLYPARLDQDTDANGNPRIRRTDVLFGPRPKLLSWEPIGGSRSCRIIWECTFAIPTCMDINFKNEPEMSFEYAITWSIDESGLTTRNITGIRTIANNLIHEQRREDKQRQISADEVENFAIVTSTADTKRKSCDSMSTAFADDADNGFEVYIDRRFPRLDGFSRNIQRSLSANRRSIAFIITDREIDSGGMPYYPGAVRMDLTQSTSSEGPFALSQWVSRISGTITVKPGLTKKVAHSAFLQVVDERKKKMMQAAETYGRWKGAGDVQGDQSQYKVLNEVKQPFIVRSFSVEEELFGRSVTFSVEFWFVCAFENVVASAGHYQVLSEDEIKEGWAKWKTSMDGIQEMRGYRQLTYDRTKEVIIGLCDQDRTESHPLPAVTKWENLSGDAGEAVYVSPDPQSSWIAYQNDIHVLEDTNTATQRIIEVPDEYYSAPKDAKKDRFRQSEYSAPGSEPTEDGPAVIATIASARDAGDTTSNPDGTPTGQEGVQSRPSNKYIVRRSSSTFRVRMVGYAVRAGRASPIPELFEIDGSKCELVNRKASVLPYSRGETSIWVTRWSLLYEVDGYPSGDLSRLGVGGAENYYGHQLSEGLS